MTDREISKIEHMPDAELIALVRSVDALANGFDRRFEGDDAAICGLMEDMGLKQTIVDKLLIQGLVLRECVARGLKINRGN